MSNCGNFDSSSWGNSGSGSGSSDGGSVSANLLAALGTTTAGGGNLSPELVERLSEILGDDIPVELLELLNNAGCSGDSSSDSPSSGSNSDSCLNCDAVDSALEAAGITSDEDKTAAYEKLAEALAELANQCLPVGATQKHCFGVGTMTSPVLSFNQTVPLVAGVDEINHMPSSITVDANGCGVFTAPCDGIYELTFNDYIQAIWDTPAPAPFVIEANVDVTLPTGGIERINQDDLYFDPVIYTFGLSVSGGSMVAELTTGQTLTVCSNLAITATDGVVTLNRDPGIRKATMAVTYLG